MHGSESGAGAEPSIRGSLEKLAVQLEESKALIEKIQTTLGIENLANVRRPEQSSIPDAKTPEGIVSARIGSLEHLGGWIGDLNEDLKSILRTIARI